MGELENRVKDLENKNSELEERLSTLQNENQMLRHVRFVYLILKSSKIEHLFKDIITLLEEIIN